MRFECLKLSYQLITAAKNAESELAEKIRRDGFIKTTKSITRQGLMLMWAMMLLMSIIFTESNPVRLICSGVAFALIYFYYMAAVRNGGIFEYIVVRPNHSGRQSIFVVTILINAAGFTHLAIYSNPVILPAIGIVTVAALTLLCKVGIVKGEEK